MRKGRWNKLDHLQGGGGGSVRPGEAAAGPSGQAAHRPPEYPQKTIHIHLNVQSTIISTPHLSPSHKSTSWRNS
jgi:hypothetical protein